MHVIATAGHVDHGKSTLVRSLTGMEPDRWAEERRRGLTIDLGFAWTELDGQVIAFVDVPGHERFVPNMLAGVGPVPAVLFVVAADEGWSAQSDEHLAALDALGVRHGLLVVTKIDRAEPGPVLDDALARLEATTLGRVPAVAVSGRSGAGLPALRAALVALVGRLPAPDPLADLRLWVDRVFSVRGAGTVVTGTLTAGTIRAGDELEVASTGERVRVRGLQTLGEDVGQLGGAARVAVNVRGLDRRRIARGDALLAPDAWLRAAQFDVRLRGVGDRRLPAELVLHLGSASVPVRVRPLGDDTARLLPAAPLPLRTGDRGALRNPGAHRIAAGVEVLDVVPPSLRGRGAAARRAAELAGATPAALAAALLARRGCVPAGLPRSCGLPTAGTQVADWLVDEDWWREARANALRAFDTWCAADPLAAGMPIEALRQRAGLPDPALLAPLLGGTRLRIEAGLVCRTGTGLPGNVLRALREIDRDLARNPFAAPDSAQLSRLGLGHRELAAAVRAGRLERVTEGVYLGPDASARAAAVLAGLPETFTVSEARRALDSTRRVTVPLLESLDAAGYTERIDDAGLRRFRRDADTPPRD